ncbi:MAG: type I phosphomannose isomerase catalytic subunit [Akkermansia sp.]
MPCCNSDYFPMSKKEAFRCIPMMFERIWGGRQIQNLFGRSVDAPHGSETVYGESWEISDRDEAQSMIAEGAFEGMTLHELWETRREEIFGAGYEQWSRFPVLCKILDACDDLSLQVHPTHGVAIRRKADEKSEIWYVVSKCPDATMYVGMKQKEAKESVRDAIAHQTLKDMLNSYQLERGESIFLPSGMAHGLGAGYVIFEIQQNSDTTYRLYDWGRKDKEGKSRQLHIEEALECLDEFEGTTMPRPAGEGVVLDTKSFVIEEFALDASNFVPHRDPEHFIICTIVDGTLLLTSGIAKQGDFIIVPAHASGIQAGDGGARVLVTSVPFS